MFSRNWMHEKVYILYLDNIDKINKRGIE